MIELPDRVLRQDGVSVLDPERVQDFLLRGLSTRDLRVTELTDEICAFNAKVPQADRIALNDSDLAPPDLSWKLPIKYLELDIDEHVPVVFGERLPSLAYNSAQTELAINRVALELQEFKQRGLYPMLRTIVYVLDRFKETGQIYGVGRGSSCASFVLFLLGLHVVDSIKYDVPMSEFFHD